MNKRPPPGFRTLSVPFLQRLIGIIEAHYPDESFGVAQLSQLLCLCPMQVHRKVKKHTGLTPGKYLLRFRLRKAYHRLCTTDLAVGEIAWQTGFGSHAAFSRAFQRIYHCSPSRMRLRMAEDVIK